MVITRQEKFSDLTAGQKVGRVIGETMVVVLKAWFLLPFAALGLAWYYSTRY